MSRSINLPLPLCEQKSIRAHCNIPVNLLGAFTIYAFKKSNQKFCMEMFVLWFWRTRERETSLRKLVVFFPRGRKNWFASNAFNSYSVQSHIFLFAADIFAGQIGKLVFGEGRAKIVRRRSIADSISRKLIGASWGRVSVAWDGKTCSMHFRWANKLTQEDIRKFAFPFREMMSVGCCLREQHENFPN